MKNGYIMNDNPSVDFRNPETLPKPVGYSHIVKVHGGNLVFISGQVAMDRSGNVVGMGNYVAQTEQVFKNIGSALDSVGSGFSDLVRLGFYVLDMNHLQEVREVRDMFIDTSHPPASTAVQVSRLFRPELLVEIDAIAILNK